MKILIIVAIIIVALGTGLININDGVISGSVDTRGIVNSCWTTGGEIINAIVGSSAKEIGSVVIKKTLGL